MRISDWSSDVCSSDLAILGEQLPVAADRIFLRAAHDRHPFGRLLGDEFQIIAGAREISRQILAVRGEAHEEKVAEAIEARRMAELLARIVLVVGGITSMAWHNHQPPRVGEHPAMIHALEGRRGSLALAADDRTAMGDRKSTRLNSSH